MTVDVAVRALDLRDHASVIDGELHRRGHVDRVAERRVVSLDSGIDDRDPHAGFPVLEPKAQSGE